MNIFLGAQLTLFFNDTDHPELKEGQPAFFLETPTQQKLFEEPTSFLNQHYVHSASTPSSHTWSKAAYALKSWFQYLQAIGREWLTASEQERRDYRDAYLSSISPKTGKLYGPSGVRDAMVVVRAFYEYCSKTGVYQGDIGGFLHVEERKVPTDHDAFAHTRHLTQTRLKDRALPKARPSGKVHPLRVVDLRNLLLPVGRAVLLWSWFHPFRLPDVRVPCSTSLICATKPFNGLNSIEHAATYFSICKQLDRTSGIKHVDEAPYRLTSFFASSFPEVALLLRQRP